MGSAMTLEQFIRQSIEINRQVHFSLLQFPDNKVGFYCFNPTKTGLCLDFQVNDDQLNLVSFSHNFQKGAMAINQDIDTDTEVDILSRLEEIRALTTRIAELVALVSDEIRPQWNVLDEPVLEVMEVKDYGID